MKKSIIEARAEAVSLSRQFPGILYRVMDKKGARAVCIGSDWIYRELVRCGFFTAANFKDGVEV